MVIPIGLPGTTHIPQSLDEFNTMMDNSEYPTSTFKDKKFPGPLTTFINTSTIGDCSNHSNSPVVEVIDDINEAVRNEDDKTDDTCVDFNQNTAENFNIDSQDESTNYPVDMDVGSGGDESYFEYPSDVSHYTLDISQPMTKMARQENNERYKKKKEAERRLIFSRETFDPPRSKECINIGDIISYVPGFSTQAGDSNIRFTSTVLSVRPDLYDGCTLLLDSMDRILEWMPICRKKIVNGGELVNHPGVQRHLSQFTLNPQDKLPGKSIQKSVDENDSIIRKHFARTRKNASKKLQSLLDNNVNIGNPKSRNLGNSAKPNNSHAPSKRKKNKVIPEKKSRKAKEYLNPKKGQNVKGKVVKKNQLN